MPTGKPPTSPGCVLACSGLLLAAVERRRAAGTGVVRVDAAGLQTAGVHLFTHDLAHDGGRGATGLLQVLDGERALRDGAAHLVDRHAAARTRCPAAAATAPAGAAPASGDAT